MMKIHGSCANVWDHGFTGEIGPICKSCLESLGRMDYLSGAGDW